jgi:pimeloyl-ACP methyl ester carboxylesterase
MCYPYYYMFRCFLRGTGFEDIHLPLDLKSTPILYIYGTEKNVMFHDKISLAIMEREERECRSECRVVAVEGAGHWMYVQKLEVCLEEIKRFIQ